MKKIYLLISALCFTLSASSVELDNQNRDADYVKSIVGRSAKIVDKLDIKDQSAAQHVTNIIANRYFKLNDIYEARDAALKRIKDENLEGDAKEICKKTAEEAKDAALYKAHFEFPASLSLYLDQKQIEDVKDGMTYGVVMVTYTATLEMIPSLTEEEKGQIYAWLVEAREFAMDAENSNKKHAAFGKYKGRINNYLSARGYDLTKEREEWYKRIKQKEEKKNP